MTKVASIPADVWDKQIAPHEDVRIDFMLIQEKNFTTDEELLAELQRLCEKHNISGIIFHKPRKEKRAQTVKSNKSK